jgi:ATP-dependent helicase HrpB
MDAHFMSFTSDLPIHDYQSAIATAVDENQVTIITAETGAGKSTQVPQYLASHGYTKVIVTQPRILAARNLSQRVREEWARYTMADNPTDVGYRTAQERDDTPETKILYCTDGLQLVREISGEGTTDRQVLVLDEVHEWNENMEVLIAWAKLRCNEDPRFKIVIMSATIDTAPLAAYFNTRAVIDVPGRSYPVTRSHGTDLVTEIKKKLTSTTSNVLVFLPGKAEIQDTADALEKSAHAAGVPVLPLHSQLDAAAQQLAFASYPNGKVILSTNIAQTSVTIEDIDVVIDSGLERRSEVKNGVEGLFVSQVSQADCLQRAGRAGRTKAGEYILAPYDSLPCLPFDKRPAYGTPEILRKHIDRLALRLANVGIDIETLQFFHDPSIKAIKQAKQTLFVLGAMSRDGTVTSVGKAMERYPVESSYARMLVESKQYSPTLQSKLAAIIAIQEVGGIVRGGARFTDWQRLTKQRHSDLLAQYDVYLALSQVSAEEHEELGIITKNATKATEIMRRLNSDLQDIDIDDSLLSPITNEEEPELLRCIAAGLIHQLWSIDDSGMAYHLTSSDVRELSGSTVVRHASLIAGVPFDLEVPTRDGKLQTLNLVQDATRVDVAWLSELAPATFAIQSGATAYDPRSGMLVQRQTVRVGKQSFEVSGHPVTANTKQNQKAFQRSFATWAYGKLEQERTALAGKFHTKRVPKIPMTHILSLVQMYAGGAVSLEQLSKSNRQQLLKTATLTAHLGADYVNRLAALARRGSPRGRHNAHRGWKPAHKRGHGSSRKHSR